MVILPDYHPGSPGLNLRPRIRKEKDHPPKSIIEKDDHIFILSTVNMSLYTLKKQ